MSTIEALKIELKKADAAIQESTLARLDLAQRIENEESAKQVREAHLDAMERNLRDAIIAGGEEEARARKDVATGRQSVAETDERLAVLRSALRSAESTAQNPGLIQQAVNLRRKVWRAIRDEQLARFPPQAIEALRFAHAANLLGTDGSLISSSLGAFAGAALNVHDPKPSELKAIQVRLAADHGLDRPRS